MQLGALRHRVLVERAHQARDEYGEPRPEWETFGYLWASREDLGGREFFLAQQTIAKHTTRFVARFDRDVTAQMRLVSDDVIYNIVSISDLDGRGRWMTILATRDG